MATPQKKFGLVEFLQQQLIRKDKEIEINPDEVLDKIESALETITLADLAVIQAATNLLEGITIGEVLATPVLFTPPYKWHDGGAFSVEKLRWDLGEWA